MTKTDEISLENRDSSDKNVANFKYDLYLLAIAKLLRENYVRLLSFYFHILIQQRLTDNNLSRSKTEKDSELNKSQLQSNKQETKSEKIKAWSELITSLANLLKSLAPWLWATVLIVVIIPLIGKVFITNSFQSSENQKSQANEEVVVKTSPNWNQIDQAVASALKNAHESAEGYADQELQIWVDDLMERVDSSFLDWYFGYFNQKQIEYKSFFTGINANLQSWLNLSSDQPEERIAEVITEDFQTEFAKRVLRPQIAQLQLERITNETVRYYLNEIEENIQQIPVKYQIPKGDWNRYLSEISVSIYDTEGKPSSLSLKTLAGGGAYFALKPLIAPALPVISSKVVGKLAGKAGAKIATKTGGVVAGKIGSALLDTTVGVGIILWDVWDNQQTASIEKPIMRENLADYLQEVKESLLHNSETGILTAVDSIQNTLVNSISVKQEN
ncbi:MAG: hypothetical protein ACLFM2_02685 [Halothece sp.]